MLDTIDTTSLLERLSELENEHRSEYNEEAWETATMEDYGLSEFYLGKAEAFSDCIELIKKYSINSQLDKFS
jgi:type I restriction-modification system DNA methylase subunit